MRKSTIVLLGFCGACLAQSAIAQSPNALSGKLDPTAVNEAGGIFVHTSDAFDPAQTKILAAQASENGDYKSAFGHYLAVCVGSENGNADSCYRAAEIARDNELADVPAELRSHLFERACSSGHQTACSQATDRN